MMSPHRQREFDDVYRQGLEDLADKILGLIYQSDGEITVGELRDFVEEERCSGAEERVGVPHV